MARRAAALQHGCFVGLSGGVDSGCIALRLAEMQVAHHLFSLSASEDTRVLEARHAWATLTLTLTLTRSAVHLQVALQDAPSRPERAEHCARPQPPEQHLAADEDQPSPSP